VLPKIFWIDEKGKIITGDTHTNLVMKHGGESNTILGLTAREYAMQCWHWIRCRKEPNARGKYLIQAWEELPSVKRRLENIFDVGEIVEIEFLKNKKMRTVVL